MKQNVLFSIAGVAMLLFFVGLYTENQTLRLAVKVFPVLSLAFLITPDTAFRKYVMAGLLFSALGDILLEIPANLFVFGLLAFLIGHINYIIAFVKRNSERQWLAGLFFYAVGGLIYYKLYPGLGAMKIAVAAYVFVILTMAWRAFVQRNYGRYGLWAFVGAVFFVFSDSIIAFNKFHIPIESARWLIMPSYWGAQFAIFWAAFKEQITN